MITPVGNKPLGALHPFVGRRFWSPFYKKVIEVTAYISDTDWMYKFDDGVHYYGKSLTPMSYFIDNGHEVKTNR